MEIQRITQNKKDYLDLLLLADPEEAMIDRYLERGELFVLRDGEQTVCTAVVTDEGNGECELKNIAVCEKSQRRGYGRKMMEHLLSYCSGRYRSIWVGTGNSSFGPYHFYESCGFVYSHTIKDFFVHHYPKPIYEDGIECRDMVYLRREL